MIVVIDDDQSVRETVSEILSLELKMDVKSFEGIPDFLAAGLEHIDLIISDIMMPTGSGLILEEKLPAGTPLIYLSGHADQISGTDRLILRKPISNQQLFKAVREIIADK